MLKRLRFSGVSVWVGLLWVLTGWLIYVSTYAGFAAGLLAFPLSVGYWMSNTLIQPLSLGLANYLNAFVLSVPIGVIASFTLGKLLSAIVKVCRNRIVYLRPQSRRKMVFRSKKKPLNTVLFNKPKDVEN